MSRFRDIAGQRFGRLVALEPTDQRSGSSVVWRCQCDCGNTPLIRGKSLTDGVTVSCGCYNRERAAETGKAKYANIANKRYGNLIVLEPTDQRRGSSVVWKCICDCGNTAFASCSKLRQGRTKSCGCYRDNFRKRDITNQRFGKLVALRETSQRQKHNVIWECLCDCGEIVYIPQVSLRRGGTKSCGCYHKEITSKTSRRDKTGNRYGRLIALEPTEQRGSNSCIVWRCLCDCGNAALVNGNCLQSGVTASCGCLKEKGVVYLYAMQSEGLIKLGISRNPFNRAEEIRKQLDTSIDILAYTKSNYYQEKKLHKQLEPYRTIHPAHSNGKEWFYPTDEVMAVVDSMEFQLSE